MLARAGRTPEALEALEAFTARSFLDSLVRAEGAAFDAPAHADAIRALWRGLREEAVQSELGTRLGEREILVHVEAQGRLWVVHRGRDGELEFADRGDAAPARVLAERLAADPDDDAAAGELGELRLLHVLPALTSLIVACAAPSSTELQIDESTTADSPLSVRASASTHEALRIASWSVSGTGDARTFVGLDDAEAPVATLTMQPESHERGARLLVEVDTQASRESLILTADGAVTGDGSARAVALASALYGDLKAFDASAGARPSDSLTSAGGEQIGTATDALTYSCGATIYPGHWVRCGTVFLGETSICITNNTGAHGVAYIDWFGQNFGIYPYNRTCAWRWFWGADVYVQNVSAPGVPLTVSH